MSEWFTLRGWLYALIACAVLVAASSETSEPERHYRIDWTTRHVAFWEEYLGHLSGKPNLRYLEIGVMEGRTLHWFLDHILTHPSSRAVGIDPFLRFPPHEKSFDTNMERTGHQGKALKIRAYSQHVVREMPLNSFDIIYIDGNHQSQGVFSDVAASWEVLKPGGYIIFDDMQLGRVSRVAGFFVDCFRAHIEVVAIDKAQPNTQMIIRKKKVDFEPFPTVGIDSWMAAMGLGEVP